MLLVKSADDGMHMSAAPEEPNERLASFDLWAEGIRRTNAMMCGAARPIAPSSEISRARSIPSNRPLIRPTTASTGTQTSEGPSPSRHAEEERTCRVLARGGISLHTGAR